MLSMRQILISAMLLMSFTPAAFAQPPRNWDAPPSMPSMAEAPQGPALGVLVDDIPFDRLDSLGLSHGVEIARTLPGSPASEAGLKSGDILMSINGQPVYSVARLRWLIARAEPQTALDVGYSRDGATSTVKVTPRAMQAQSEPAPPPSPGMGHPPMFPGWTPSGYMGVQLQSLTPGLRQAFDVPEDTGALVAGVEDDSPAASAGLKAGDVIVKMDRRTIGDVDDVLRVVDYFGPGEAVKVDVIRDKQTRTLTVELGEPPQDSGGNARACPHHWRHPGAEATPFSPESDWWRDMQRYMQRPFGGDRSGGDARQLSL